MALVLALGVLVALSATSVAVIDYTSANSRSASGSKQRQKAFSLGEAGINNAMSVLLLPSNNALDPCLLRPQPPDPVCEVVHGAGYGPFVSTYEDGTVSWYGVLDQMNAVWKLTSTGKMRNTTGPRAKAVVRTLSARVPVVPTNTQPANNQSWNYIMSTGTGDPDLCDMEIGNTVEVRTNLYVFGNLCWKNQAKMLRPTSGAKITLVVNGKMSLDTGNNTVGTSDAPIGEGHIAGGCKYRSQHWHPAGDGHAFCSSVDSVYAGPPLDSNAGTLVAPAADFKKWWRNASPGPFIPCATGGPIEFDNNEQATLEPDRSVTTVYNLLPSTSYTCSTLGGELSWNAQEKKLTVRGTIFFDGHVRAEAATAGAVIDYEGQAALYAYGTIAVKNVKFCAAVANGACDFTSWNPNNTMLSLVAAGSGGQNDVDVGQSIVIKSSHFQGAVYGVNDVSIDTSAKVDGPMIGAEVLLGQSVNTDDFPSITTVPAGMPGAPTVYAQSNPPEMFSG